jgi:hypothetical protein
LPFHAGVLVVIGGLPLKLCCLNPVPPVRAAVASERLIVPALTAAHLSLARPERLWRMLLSWWLETASLSWRVQKASLKWGIGVHNVAAPPPFPPMPSPRVVWQFQPLLPLLPLFPCPPSPPTLRTSQLSNSKPCDPGGTEKDKIQHLTLGPSLLGHCLNRGLVWSPSLAISRVARHFLKFGTKGKQR